MAPEGWRMCALATPQDCGKSTWDYKEKAPSILASLVAVKGPGESKHPLQPRRRLGSVLPYTSQKRTPVNANRVPCVFPAFTGVPGLSHPVPCFGIDLTRS